MKPLRYRVNLGLSLRLLMAHQRVKNDELGRFLNLSRSSVTRIRTDPVLGLHHLDKLAEYFELTPSQVLAVSENAVKMLETKLTTLLPPNKQLAITACHSLEALISHWGLDAAMGMVDKHLIVKGSLSDLSALLKRRRPNGKVQG